jgi:type II secretory pathway pseudopilin PulG
MSGPPTSRHPCRPGRGRCADRRREAGILLVALMVGMTVMMILLTASAQSWTAVMKREREEELIFRGNQYINALKAYGADHGGQYPTELKLLMEKGPKGNRYLRQLFGDPFDPDGKWNLIYLGPDGKSAWNPNARPPDPLLGEEPLGGLGRSRRASSALGGRGGGRSGLKREGGFGGEDPGAPAGSMGGLGATSPTALGRESGFSSGNLNSPIVGVVSRSDDMGFREYFDKQYYNEWEFHVFVRDIPGVKSGPVPGLNINPQGNVGPGGGLSLIPKGGSDPNDKQRNQVPRRGPPGNPPPPPKPGGN